MNIGWPDLGGALLGIALGLLVCAGAIALLAWDARRRKSPAVFVEVAAAVGRMWLALVALATVLTVWQGLSGGDTWIKDLPVSLAWPEPLACEQPVPPPSTGLVCAHVDTADVTIAALGLGTRAVLALGDALAMVLLALPAVLLVVVCGQALKGAPFSRTVSRWLFVCAAVVLIAGLGADFAGSVGRALAAGEILPPPGDGAVTSTGISYVTVPFWPIGAALGLGALAIVFRRGAVLQRETEGLV